MTRRFVTVALTCLMLGTAPAQAETARVIGFPNPPLIYELEGQAVGPAAELAADLARAAGLSPTVEIYPLARLFVTSETQAIIIPLLTRTPEREEKFQWITPIYTDELAFHTIPPGPPIKDTAAARRLGSISVRAGSSSDAFLRSNGFGPLTVQDSSAEHSAHKLARGRVDAWFTSKTMGRAIWNQEGLNHIPLQHGDTVSLSVYWIAASKLVRPEEIERIAEHFRRMKQDGSYERIFSVIRTE